MQSNLQLLAAAALASAVALTGCGNATSVTEAARAAASVPSPAAGNSVEDVMAAAHRSDEARARDEFRHPAETLAFLELEADDTVVEVFPGGGWYTDVIAPFVAKHGQYYGASYATDIPDQPAYRYRLTRELGDRFATSPELYGDAKVTALAPPTHTDIAPAGSADLIVTFRNFHGMLREDPALYMQTFEKTLKPGGILGVIQHRSDEGRSVEAMKKSGYVTEQTVIDYAEAAGLELVARSEINANAADSKDYEKGVWTLPPTLQMGEQDKERYETIGESDRMTLKFRKPE